MTTDRELMRRTWEFFSHYILVNEMAQERLDAEAETILEALRARLAQPEPREIKIEFKEWIHPHMGLVPVDPKTPLILKAVIREEV